MVAKPGEARPYRLREVRERAARLAELRAWHLFVSYAHTPDSETALHLRRYVMKVARPWWGFSNLRVFLDSAAMVATSGLPSQIAGILSSSSSLVLLAGPASAASPWVRDEVRQWQEERGKRPLVVVHTGGTLSFRPSDSEDRVDWPPTTALDRESFLAGRTAPTEDARRTTYWIEYVRPVAERLTARAGRLGDGSSPSRMRQAVAALWAGAWLRRADRAAFRRAALDVVAVLLDLDRDRLSSLERHRRRASVAVVAAVLAGLTALSTAALTEQVRRKDAEDTALSRQLAAASVADTTSDPDVAMLLAVQAYRTSPTAEAASAVTAAASGPLRRVLRGHGAEVSAVATAGTIAVTGSADGTARVWDTRTGAAVRVIDPGCGAVHRVAVSADAQILITVCDAVVRSWDLPSGTSLSAFSAEGTSFRDAVYSSERGVAVVEGEQGVAWLWRPRGDGAPRSLPGHVGQVTAAAFTVDGTMVATGDLAGNVRLWDTANGGSRGEVPGRTDTEADGLSFTFVSGLAFTPDGGSLAVARNDTNVSLWDLAGRSHVDLLADGQNGATSVAVSPDGTTVATASLDGAVRTWDTRTGSLQHTMPLGGWIPSVRFSHDGKNLLAVSDNHTAALWDVPSGALGATLAGHADGVRAGEFCPDDECVVTASADGSARLWTTANVSARDTYDSGGKDLRALVYGTHGTVLATVALSGPAILLDPHHLAAARQLDIGSGGQAVDVSPDESTVATGGDDHLLRLWDRATGRQLSIHPGHTGAISGVTFSPDGTLIATTGYDTTVRLWDAHTGEQLHVLPGTYENAAVLAFSPTSDLLATSSMDEQVQVWDTRSGALLQTVRSPHPLPQQSNGVKALVFSPNGSMLATSGDDHTVCLWDPRSGALIRALRDATDGVRQVEFSPDGTQVAAAGDEHLARIWDVATGRQLFVLGGYTDELTSLAYSRDGRLVAVGSYDGTLRFWDGHTGLLLKTVRRDLGFDLSLFSPDGTALTSMGFDGVLRTWDPPPSADDAVTAVCAALGRDLTDAEWGRYVTGRPRRASCS